MKLCFYTLLLLVMNPAFANEEPSASAKNYPGARDEDLIVVQKELANPEIKIDRRTLEAKIRENMFKSKDVKSTPPTTKSAQ